MKVVSSVLDGCSGVLVLYPVVVRRARALRGADPNFVSLMYSPRCGGHQTNVTGEQG